MKFLDTSRPAANFWSVSNLETHVETRVFFHERLQRALDAVGVEVSEETELYLLELLAAGGALAGPDQPLVQRLAEAMQAEQASEKLERFRATGDAALYTLGFFSDHLEKRGISREYYCGLGSRAYRAAGSLSSVHSTTFGELAGDFERLSHVLEEVREETVLRTPQDIVRLYDRWRKTGSSRLAERLRREGVFPTRGGGLVH